VEGLPRRGWVCDGYAVSLFDSDRELKGIDGVEAEAVRAKKLRGGLNFFRRNPQHAVIDQEPSDIVEGNGVHLKI